MPASKSPTTAWSSNSNASAFLCTGAALLRPKSARSIAKTERTILMSPSATTQTPLSESAFIAGFHAIGEERYHHKHPFHLLMHEGKLPRGQLQAWALNRYYYQSRIPIKDAAILARTEDPAFRLAWRKRILDHDGDGTKPGGIEKWLKLVEATGLSREQAIRGEGILPATRYAVQAYVDFVCTKSHTEAVASSLTEMFSKKLITLRVDC